MERREAVTSAASSFLSSVSLPAVCTLSSLLSPVDLFFFPRFHLSSPKRPRRTSTEISTKHTPHGRVGSKKANPRAFARQFATWDKDGKSDWLAHRAFPLDWSSPRSLFLSLSLFFSLFLVHFGLVVNTRRSEKLEERARKRGRKIEG